MQHKTGGFTLIELSIVLVIIGLIVGGILTGRELIAAAQIRATLAQEEKFNTAINTFRGKYGNIPGDILYSDAARFGLAATSSGGAGLGDGNGLIQDPLGTNTPVGEILLFWRQLSDAKLIDGSYGADLTVSTAQGPSTIIPGNEFPLSKLGRESFFIVGSDGGINYMGLLEFVPNGVTGGAAGTAAYFPIRVPSVTPIEGYKMDTKIDDGLPLLGLVQARGYGAGDILAAFNGFGNSPYWTATSSPPACIIGGAWPITNFSIVTYNTIPSSGGDIPNCAMRFQFN